MKQTIIVALLLGVIAGAAYFAWRKSDSPAANVRQVGAQPRADLRIACRHCGALFAPDQARPLPGNQMMLLCPKCGKPTPRQAARGKS